MSEDFEQGSIAAANAIIAFLQTQGHAAVATDVLRAWEDGTITGPAHEPGNQVPGVNGTWVSPNDAKSHGFTGDQCSNCGGSHMQIAGHCQVCADCGTTTGCS